MREDHLLELGQSLRRQSKNEVMSTPEVEVINRYTAVVSKMVDQGSTVNCRGAADGEVNIAGTAWNESNGNKLSKSSYCSGQSATSMINKNNDSDTRASSIIVSGSQESDRITTEVKDVVQSTPPGCTTSTCLGERHLVLVDLQKDSTGVGFSIEGGRLSLDGDRPIVIKRLFTGIYYHNVVIFYFLC